MNLLPHALLNYVRFFPYLNEVTPKLDIVGVDVVRS